MLPRHATLVHQEMPHSPREALPEDRHEILPMIQTLPADVLREIFRRCIPPFKYQESTNFELDKPPYTLAKVCRHWRSVCLSTPLLWVDFPIFTGETPITPEFSGHWRTKLALSSPCDLRLYINHYGISEAAVAKRLEPIRTAFSRARTLDLCADMPMLRVISQHADLFKRLQVLKINLTAGTPNNPNLIPQLDFHSKVTSLTLQSRKRVEVARRLLKGVETLLPNLTKFDGEYLPASSFREILAVSPLLTQLTIRNVQAASPSASVSSPLIHTHLKMLHLLCKPSKAVGNPGETLPIDLFGIRLSELEDLVVQYPLPTMSSAFLVFLQHTQGYLRNLYIGGVFESSYDQKAMYDLCPRLETLTIGYANDESLKHLTLTGSSGNKLLCPRLRHLTLPSFRLNPAFEYDLQTLWLSELTSCRFWRPNDPDVPIDCVPLESFTVVLSKASNFLYFQSLQDLSLTIPYYLSGTIDLNINGIELPRGLFIRLKKYVAQSLYSICFLDDLGLLSFLKEFIEREANSADTRALQEETRLLYADLITFLDDMREKPHWKLEKVSTLRKKLEKFVFKNYLADCSSW